MSGNTAANAQAKAESNQYELHHRYAGQEQVGDAKKPTVLIIAETSLHSGFQVVN